ncbi:hypothetical protein CC1G_15680 [Coprinopsis cinerea okayama7|uniref:Uncharacterized protein n=1 Tax=Coprinopsis cinerea (strain Okayama-7 / 130 / ATCC MYA-4618 / FGSC 9003) TaxID=240176 RepID=D6RQE0_COPC7|nr:hypothetical protein CC1G_15680 [Coprinopsis cinerea okayama7\|eukprot:XP_002910250.1 hypothetical protein CC1G_15680 [Coprinopsis cinerea okayama7\
MTEVHLRRAEGPLRTGNKLEKKRFAGKANPNPTRRDSGVADDVRSITTLYSPSAFPSDSERPCLGEPMDLHNVHTHGLTGTAIA